MAQITIAGDIEQGKPLLPTASTALVPDEVIEDYERVYRVRQAPEVRPDDLLIVEPRTTAFTGELVLAFRGASIFLGHWWAKHGLRELHLSADGRDCVTGDLQILGAVTLIVRTK